MAKKILSIDLETLDTTRTAVILEIGITVGDETGKVIEQFQIFPNVSEQIAAGRTVSGDTVLWWMKQDGVIQAEQANAKRYSVDDTRAELESFLKQHADAQYVLGNAPSFDCDIVADFLGHKPWNFWIERDVRTARMKVSMGERFDNKAEHSGLADSEAQFHDFVTYMKK